MSDDARLVERAQAGDVAAFAEVYDRYQPLVYRYVFYRVGDTPVAEDLTAEVFVRVVEKIDRFVYRGQPLLAWLYAIARNLVADFYRQTKRSDALALDEGAASAAPLPEQAAEDRLTQQQLVAALARLTEEQRQVILLKFVEGMDNETVASLLGKPVGAVKSLQHRALAALRRMLERGELPREGS